MKQNKAHLIFLNAQVYNIVKGLNDTYGVSGLDDAIGFLSSGIGELEKFIEAMPGEKSFFWNDKPGGGRSATLELSSVVSMDDETDWDGYSLHMWAVNCDEGEEWENATDKYICITSTE